MQWKVFRNVTKLEKVTQESPEYEIENIIILERKSLSSQVSFF
jgi:hypothetical protein